MLKAQQTMVEALAHECGETNVCNARIKNRVYKDCSKGKRATPVQVCEGQLPSGRGHGMLLLLLTQKGLSADLPAERLEFCVV